MKKISESETQVEEPKTPSVEATEVKPEMKVSEGGGVKPVKKSDNTTTIFIIIGIIVVIGFLIYLNMQKKNNGSTGNSPE